MKIGIIGAMAEEMTILLASVQEAKSQTIQHLTFVEGLLKGCSVVLVQSGIGKVNSTIATTLLITQFKVEKIINTGSAGRLVNNLSIGDTVISKRAAYHDANATAFGYEIGQIPGMPRYYEADKQLVQASEKVLNNLKLHSELGDIVSADSFIASKEHIQDIQKNFPLALCTEMEGASIAQTCHIFNIPFVIIRAISDGADEEANISFEEFLKIAGKRSAEMVMYLLEELV